MKLTKKNSSALLILMALLCSCYCCINIATFAHAEDVSRVSAPTYQIEPPNPQFKTIPGALNVITSFAYKILIPLFTVLILWGGFLMLTAGDSEPRYKQGLTVIKYAAIGAAVILLAMSIQYFVADLLGVDSSNLLKIK